jgi:hypothetical protein
VQCLEGPRPAVNELYATILRDERHSDVVLLEYGDTQNRLFADWSMAFLKSGDIARDVFNKYTGTRKFDPYLLNSEQARNFLMEIVAGAREKLSEQKLAGR